MPTVPGLRGAGGRGVARHLVRGLGHRVGLDHGSREQVFQFGHDAGRQRRRGGSDEAQVHAIDDGGVAGGPCHDRLVHGRDRGIPRRVTVGEPCEDLQCAESGRAVHASARVQGGQNARHQPVNVKERHHVHAPVCGLQAKGPADVRGGRTHVAMEQRHDLRARGRAGGVEDKRDVVGPGHASSGGGRPTGLLHEPERSRGVVAVRPDLQHRHPERGGGGPGGRIVALDEHHRLRPQVRQVELELGLLVRRIERGGGGARGRRDEGAGHLGSVGEHDGHAVAPPDPALVQPGHGLFDVSAKVAVGEVGASGRGKGDGILGSGPQDHGDMGWTCHRWLLRQRQRDQLAGVAPRPHRHHDELPPFVHVGHGQSGLIRRQLELGDHLTRGLVVGAELVPARPCRGEHPAALAGEQQCTGHEDAAPVRPPGHPQLDALQRGVVPYVLGRVAVGDLPRDLAGIQVDRGDPAPWRLEEREALGPTPAAQPKTAAPDVVHVGDLGFVDERDDARRGGRLHVQVPGLGVHRATRPVGASQRPGHHERALGASLHGHGRGRVQGAVVQLCKDLLGLGPQLGGEIDEVVGIHALTVVGGRPGGEGLGGGGAFAGNICLLHGSLLDGPHGLPRPPVQDEGEGLLGDQRDGLDRAPVNDQVHQDRGRGGVVVPDPVVDGLVVPDPLPGGRIQRNQALGEEVLAWPVAAVVVACAQLDGQVDVPQRGVGAQRGPHGGVARVRPGIVFPGVVSVLAGLGDGVEGPAKLARDRVEAAHVAGGHLGGGGRTTGGQGRADHDNPVHDDRRRTGPDWRAHQVQVAAQAEAQVDHAVVPEARDRSPRSGIQRDQMEARRHHEDARPRVRRRPVGDAPARIPSRGRAVPFVHAVGPQGLAGTCVDGHDRATVSRRGVQDVAGHEWRGAVVVLWARTVVGGRPAPRDLQGVHVVAVDLIERRVAGAAGVAPVEAPLPVGCSLLAGGAQGREEKRGRGDQQGRSCRAHGTGVQGATPGAGGVSSAGSSRYLADGPTGEHDLWTRRTKVATTQEEHRDAHSLHLMPGSRRRLPRPLLFRRLPRG